MSGVAMKHWRKGFVLLALLALGALSLARHVVWLGAFLVAWVVASVWGGLLAAFLLRGMPQKIRSKEHRIRVNIFGFVFLAGMMVLLRVLSPLWR